MYRILIIICLSISISCNTKKETEETETISLPNSTSKENTQKNASQEEPKNIELDSASHRTILLKKEFKSFELNNLKDTIKADLNGDKILDFAFFVNSNTKRELFIIDGKSNKKNKIGQDKSFGKMSDDFSWVDYWGTTNDRETFEILIEDSEIIGDTITKLINKSIFVRKDEVGGGVITHKDNRFIWVHQSD